MKDGKAARFVTNFEPPKRGKGIYLACNLLLLGFLYYCIAFRGVRTAWAAFAAAGFCLFNGIWSLDRRLYSWLHRDDPAHRRVYILFFVFGGAFLALGILALVL